MAGEVGGDHRGPGDRANLLGSPLVPIRRSRSTPACVPRAATGPLVRTLESYASYYGSGRSPGRFRRCCGPTGSAAGDEDLGLRFLLMADETRYPSGGVSPTRCTRFAGSRHASPPSDCLAARTRTLTRSLDAAARRHRVDRPVAAAAPRTPGSSLRGTSTAGDAQRDWRVPGCCRKATWPCCATAWLTATRARNAAGPGEGQAQRSAAGAGATTQCGGTRSWLGQRRRRRVPGQLPAGHAAGKGREYERFSRREHGFAFTTVTTEEYERLCALYEPLTQSLRRLVAAGIRTGVDEATIHQAREAIDAVSETLERTQQETTSMLRHAETGGPLAWTNPAVGLRNAIAPPMDVQHEPDGTPAGPSSTSGSPTRDRRDWCTAASARSCLTTCSVRPPAMV